METENFSQKEKIKQLDLEKNYAQSHASQMEIGAKLANEDTLRRE